ncbi:MAG: DMT family transporter [Myxococcales bacterium]|nr:DMT family transporter [Myxococcales bacterium]
MSPGLWYLTVAALAFSGMSALVKLASATLPSGEIVLARAVVTLVLSAVMVARLARREGRSPWGRRRGALISRGAFGFVALGCYYWSLGHMPLAEATMIQQSAPIWGAMLAWVWLAEPVARRTALALALGLAGVAMVAQPSGHGLAPAAVAIAIVGAIMAAAALVTVRQLAADEHPLVIVFYFPLVALPAALAWAAPTLVWPSGREWLLLLGVGACTQLAQVCMTYGMAREPAARAMATGYLQVAFAVGWGLVVFDELPVATTWLGAGLIVVGLAAMATGRRAAVARR